MQVENPLQSVFQESASTNAGISREDALKAVRLTQFMGIIAGSYITNPETANDIDVFIKKTDWASYNQNGYYSEKYNLIAYDPQEGSEEYDQDMINNEIVFLYRSGGLNVIIVDDMYWPAYISAHRTIVTQPHNFTEKYKRHNQFIMEKNVIRRMLGEEARELKEP